MKCEKCIHYGICVVNSYCHEPCGYYEEDRPHGEWKPDGTCSECGVYSSLNKDTAYFCPNCGADMRKEGDEK